MTKYVQKYKNTVLLPPLERVTRSDLEDWYEEFESNEHIRSKLVDQLINDIKKETKQKDTDAWNMSVVEAQLKKIIEAKENTLYGI